MFDDVAVFYRRLNACHSTCATQSSNVSLSSVADKIQPDQARVPAGSRDGGQWTTEGGGGGSGSGGGGSGGSERLYADENTGSVHVSTDESDTDSHSNGVFDIEFVGSRTIVSIDYSRALTGISTIDDTTKKLSETLGDTMARVDRIPEWAPSVYGTADIDSPIAMVGLPDARLAASDATDRCQSGFGCCCDNTAVFACLGHDSLASAAFRLIIAGLLRRIS